MPGGQARGRAAARGRIHGARQRDGARVDTVTSGDAARLCERMGWTRVGDIPRCALMPDGVHAARRCKLKTWMTPLALAEVDGTDK